MQKTAKPLRFRMDGEPYKTRTDFKHCLADIRKRQLDARLEVLGVRLIGSIGAHRSLTRFRGKCGHAWTADIGRVYVGHAECPTCLNRKFRAKILREMAEAEALCALMAESYQDDE